MKIQFAVEEVLRGAPNASELADLLEAHYGTREFSVLDSDELDQYVEELMLEGELSVEPEFLPLEDGSSYRILITVRSPSVKDQHYE